MDNLQFWIWLIVIIVTFIARAGKKKPDGAPTTFGGEPVEQHKDTNDKPISFEDLLREIQASKVPSPAPVTRKQEYLDYDDELEEEAVVEQVDYSKRNDDSTFQAYERAKQEAFNRASLEETMKVEDTIVRFGQFRGYQQEKEENLLAEYVKELQDPNGFKKAFILSEVLNRKF